MLQYRYYKAVGGEEDVGAKEEAVLYLDDVASEEADSS